jgi:ubiquinone/menaquinone biosynthesis C-methylase UbiE
MFSTEQAYFSNDRDWDYTKWAKAYDEDMKTHDARGHGITTNFVDIYIKNKSDSILDIGAGTGIIGYLLANKEYTNIYGLEPCKEMIEVANSKGCYRNFFNEGVYPNKETSLGEGIFIIIFQFNFEN